MKAIKQAVIIQTLSVAISAGATAVILLINNTTINNTNNNATFASIGLVSQLCLVAIFIFGIIAGIASQARRIAVEMDWIVVLSDN